VALYQKKQPGALNLMLVANSKIKLELSGRKFRMTLSLTIRHQHQFEEEPGHHYQKQLFLRLLQLAQGSRTTRRKKLWLKTCYSG
jgi:hypothetical protein